jgi:hypothetical protein
MVLQMKFQMHLMQLAQLAYLALKFRFSFRLLLELLQTSASTQSNGMFMRILPRY